MCVCMSACVTHLIEECKGEVFFSQGACLFGEVCVCVVRCTHRWLILVLNPVVLLLLCVSHPGRCDGDDWWLAVLKRVMDEGCYVLAEIMKDWGADVHIQMCVCDRSH